MKFDRLGLLAIFLGATCTVVFSYLTAYGMRDAGLAGLAISLALGVAVWALVRDTLGTQSRPFRLILSVYLVLFFLLPGYFHIQFYGFPFEFGTYYTRGEIARASLIALLFVVCFHFGYLLCARREPLPRPVMTAPPTLMSGEPKHATAWALLLVALAFGTVVGWSQFLVPRIDTEIGGSIGSLLTSTIARGAAFLALLYALVGRFNWARVPVILLSAAVFLYFHNPIAVPRFVLAGFLFAYYILFFGFGKRARMFFVFSLFIGILTVFPIMSELSRGDIDNFTRKSLLETYVETPDFDGLQSVANVVKYVQGTGIKFGLNILSALLFFVPRAVWPSKSPGTGLDAAEYAGYDMTNISAPLPSEFYVDFSWPGVMAGAFLLGWVACRGDARFSQAGMPLYLRLVLGTIFGFAIILMRGSLVSVMGQFAFTVGMLLLVSRIQSVLMLLAPRKRLAREPVVTSRRRTRGRPRISSTMGS